MHYFRVINNKERVIDVIREAEQTNSKIYLHNSKNRAVLSSFKLKDYTEMNHGPTN